MMSDEKIVLFDGVCHLCTGSVQFIIRRDKRKKFRFASLQSDVGRRLVAEHGLDPAAVDTVVLIEDGRAFARSAAAVRIARHLDGAWKLAAAFWIVPRPLRDFLYRLLARFRYRWFGKHEACWLPTPELRSRFLEDAEVPLSPSPPSAGERAGVRGLTTHKDQGAL
jgi:predicted DCC family thiol-disulfide oxidoreductase YuxK